jgi:hypothetical protein
MVSEPPDIEQLKAQLAESGLSDRDRSRLLFRLGGHHVSCGEAEQAFSCYLEGNRLMPNVKKDGRLAIPDWKRISRVNKGLLQNLKQELGAGLSEPMHCPAVVVAGLPRAGKSLTERLLARLPGFIAGGELAYVKKFVAKQESKETSFLALAKKLYQGGTSELSDRYQQLINSSTEVGPTRVIDTSPANLSRLGLVSLAYPTLPIILCERSFLDLGVAIYFKKFRRGHEYSYSLSTLGATIAVVERVIDHWYQTLPNPMLRLRYEDLATDPSGVVDKLAAFMGVSLSPQEKHERFGDLFQPVLEKDLHPSYSMDHLGGITPGMIGFSRQFEQYLEPMKVAYAITRQKIR